MEIDKILYRIGVEKLWVSSRYLRTKDLRELMRVLKLNNITGLLIKYVVTDTASLIYPVIVKKQDGSSCIVLSGKNQFLQIYDIETRRTRNYTVPEFNSTFNERMIILSEEQINYTTQLNELSFDKRTVSQIFLVISKIIILAVLLFAIIGLIVSQYYLLALLLMCNAVGLYLSITYSRMEYGSINNLARYICSKNNPSLNCAKGFNEHTTIPFALLSIAYFLSGIVMLLLFQITSHSSVYGGLMVLNIAGFVFSGVSLLYQYVVFKSFCRLCVIISSLALVNFILTLIITAATTFASGFQGIFQLLFVISCSLLFSYYYRSLLGLDNEIEQAKNREFIFWSDRENVIKNLVTSDKFIEDYDAPIVLGENSKERLVLILSVDCPYCINVFLESLNLFLMNKDFEIHVYLKYRRTSLADRTFLDLVSACSDERLIEAIDIIRSWDSYKSDDYKKALLPEEAKTLRINAVFFENNKYKSFPRIYLNNNRLPSIANFSYCKVALS